MRTGVCKCGTLSAVLLWLRSSHCRVCLLWSPHEHLYEQCKSAEAWASTRTEELSELLMDIDDDDAPHVLLELIQRRSPGMQELYGDGCGTLHEP